MPTLPFAGIPPELSDSVEKILQQEPQHTDRLTTFSHVNYPQQNFSLRSFLAPFKTRLLLALCIVIIGTIAQNAGPIIIAYAVDHGIMVKDFNVLLILSGIYLLSLGINLLMSYFNIIYTGRLGQMLIYHLRILIFSHLQRLSMEYYLKTKAGQLMARMTSDIEALSSLLQDGLINLVVHGLSLVVMTAALFYLNSQLAWFLLLMVVPTMTIATIWFRKTSNVAYKDARHHLAEVMSDFQESLAGIRLITAHNRRKHNNIQHRNKLNDYRLANNKTARVSAAYTAFSEFIGMSGKGFIVLVGYHMVINGELTLGELLAFLLFLGRFFSPIQILVGLYNGYQSGQAALNKLKDLLATKPSVAEKPNAIQLPPITGDIKLENVSFYYAGNHDTSIDNNKNKFILKNINLHIKAGETIAFVGPTGAGKSTLANLITRFYDPVEGRILIDDIDLKDASLTSLRQQLGVVPQEPFLFHGSIRHNICFAKPDATDEEVAEACQAVGMEEMIRRLPAGLDTPCYERGASLSSGERQLLALARAFLSRPRVLLLDEATSNIDLQTEAKIEMALDKLLAGRTAILIAHRLSTVQRADRIVVIDQQGIQEIGSHNQLMKLKGIYAGMIKTWEKSLSPGTKQSPSTTQYPDKIT